MAGFNVITEALLSASPYVSWPAPSLMLTKGTWLGAIRLSHFTPPPYLMNWKDGVATSGFPEVRTGGWKK
jgi:hypothetical protein